MLVQPEPNGTGGAVRAAAGEIGADDTVARTDRRRAARDAGGDRAAHAAHERRAAATMVTMMLDDPSGYGRVVRDDDGHVERVVETKVAGDATASSSRSARSTPASTRSTAPRCSTRCER